MHQIHWKSSLTQIEIESTHDQIHLDQTEPLREPLQEQQRTNSMLLQ